MKKLTTCQNELFLFPKYDKNDNIALGFVSNSLKLHINHEITF